VVRLYNLLGPYWCVCVCVCPCVCVCVCVCVWCTVRNETALNSGTWCLIVARCTVQL